MQVDITGHHVEITEALRDYVGSKLDKLERYFDNAVDVHVVLTVEKQSQKAEATLSVSGAKLYAGALDGDMYAAIDGLINKLDRQIVKHKEKRADHHRREGSVSQALEE